MTSEYFTYTLENHLWAIGNCSLVVVCLLVAAYLLYIKEMFRCISICGLLVYLVCYICLAILCKESGLSYLYDFRSFRILSDFTAANVSTCIAGMIVSILLFIPIGVLSSFVFHFNYPHRKRYTKAIALGFSISIIIEIMQLVTKTGDSAPDDILFNLAGCLVGVYIYRQWLSELWISDLSKRINDKKRFYDKVYCKIIRSEIISEWRIWAVFGIALILPFMSYGGIGFHSNFLHKMRVMFDNLSYSYIAGMLFYLFTSFSTRVRKIFKAKLQLEKSYSSIDMELQMLACNMNCIDDNGKMHTDASDRMKGKLTLHEPESKCVLSSIVRTFSDTIACKKRENEYVGGDCSRMNIVAMQNVKSVFSLVITEVDNALNRFSEVMTDEELKDLNAFRHIHEKLFFSSLAEYSHTSEIRISNNDLDYFISDFLLNIKKAESLAKEYKQYSFYAMNSEYK